MFDNNRIKSFICSFCVRDINSSSYWQCFVFVVSCIESGFLLLLRLANMVTHRTHVQWICHIRNVQWSSSFVVAVLFRLSFETVLMQFVVLTSSISSHSVGERVWHCLLYRIDLKANERASAENKLLKAYAQSQTDCMILVEIVNSYADACEHTRIGARESKLKEKTMYYLYSCTSSFRVLYCRNFPSI